MKNKSIKAEIRPIDSNEYLNKQFLRIKTCKDPLNGCPNECHYYIPTPTEKFPDLNYQIYFKNGRGKNLMRFSDPICLADWLREIADDVTSDESLDAWQRLVDTHS